MARAAPERSDQEREAQAARLRIAWFALVALTVGYLAIDATADDRVPNVAVTLSAIALAMLKYRVVLREFMAVRQAPRSLRRITDALVVVIALALVASYVVGRATA